MGQRFTMKIACICRHNMNRSMEAHETLSKKYKKVSSYGTGKRCKLPGRSADEPVHFDFGTPYAEMFEELSQRDPRLYEQNGCLEMVERNMRVKRAPQRWANHEGHCDVVLTFERVVFNAVLEELNRRADENDGAGEPCQVVNIETIDRKKEAVTGAAYAAELVDLVRPCLLPLRELSPHTCMPSSRASCAWPYRVKSSGRVWPLWPVVRCCPEKGSSTLLERRERRFPTRTPQKNTSPAD